MQAAKVAMLENTNASWASRYEKSLETHEILKGAMMVEMNDLIARAKKEYESEIVLMEEPDSDLNE